VQLDRSLRLPLSTGASPINLALGIGIIGFLGAAPIFIGSLLPTFTVAIPGILIAIWFLALMVFPSVAKKQRASDVVLSKSGVRIEGGPYSGQQIAWSELSAAPARLTNGSGSSETCLRLPGGRQIVTSEAEERASLAALARTLSAFTQGHDTAQHTLPSQGDNAVVPLCPECGAPLTPSADERVSCRHCRATAPVADALRARVLELRSLTQARTQTRRALFVLSRWPSSGRLNVVLAIAALPLVLGWPVSGVLASEYFQYHDVFTWRDVGILFVSTAAVTLGLCFWLVGQSAHRQAFGLVVASFHAVRIADDGLGCHQCGAPLAVAPDTPLVPCAYCRSDNVVLGLDLHPRVSAEAAQAATLDQLLRARLRSIRVWRWLSLASAVLIVLGGVFLFEPLQRAFNDPGARHAPVDRDWSYSGPTLERATP
jgi:hypothetical protein